MSQDAVKTFTLVLMEHMKELRKEPKIDIKFTVVENVQQQKASGKNVF